MNTCVYESCPQSQSTRGLCKRHYTTFWRAGTLEDHALPKPSSEDHHKLLERNTESGQGTCSVCGPVKIYLINKPTTSYWVCSVKANATGRPRKHVGRYIYADDQVIPREVVKQARQELSEAQKGLCVICNRETDLHLDHCHETGKIRGLLCVSCNTGLGKFKDNPQLLERAAEYLRQN